MTPGMGPCGQGRRHEVRGRLAIPGDVATPEQYQLSESLAADGVPTPWEACQTLNGSWGYDSDNLDYKPVNLLVRMLVDGVSKDGNILLNVGPTARGNFDPRPWSPCAG
ncbi:alpha-L-fucosidase [Arthrobacter sp.]|uniref:alpha-L-fucosidase n=1 Tax=Arthrobacter sp. TaxID=1667 RepID=UPI0028109CA3|nr:alpha-L-fucosidase [Arthrobacter sp.]